MNDSGKNAGNNAANNRGNNDVKQGIMQEILLGTMRATWDLPGPPGTRNTGATHTNKCKLETKNTTKTKRLFLEALGVPWGPMGCKIA